MLALPLSYPRSNPKGKNVFWPLCLYSKCSYFLWRIQAVKKSSFREEGRDRMIPQWSPPDSTPQTPRTRTFFLLTQKSYFF